MRKMLSFLALALAAGAAQPAEMYPWREHAPPLGFLFGNEIDGHQQSARTANGRLAGYLYIRFTGVVTQDGQPVATHADCASAGDCRVGWAFVGHPVRAKLVRQPMHDHPLFWIGRADIPQPGSPSHFHWTGAAMPMPYLDVDGYALELTAVGNFCFIHHGADAASAAATCRDNGGVPVRRGPDVATHLNIVTSDPAGP